VDEEKLAMQREGPSTEPMTTSGRFADHLYVSRATVKTHVESIYLKLGVSCPVTAPLPLGA
jgi:hypothetical protein